MPKPRDAKLEPADKAKLRKIRARIGVIRTLTLFMTSNTSLELLLADGGVQAEVRDRIAAQLQCLNEEGESCGTSQQD